MASHYLNRNIVVAKKKLNIEIPPIPMEPRVTAYDRAVLRTAAGLSVDMPVAFDHPTLLRASGTITGSLAIGVDPYHKLPDFELEVTGRSGKVINVKMLDHHCQIYHTFSEADADVENYRLARGLK